MICLRVELSGEINKRASLSQRRTHQPDTFLRQQRGQGNFERPQSVADGGKYPAGAGFGITGRKTEKAGKNLKKWLAFLERECYTVRRTFVNAFFFCAQKTGFFHHEQAQECVLAKKEKGGFT